MYQAGVSPNEGSGSDYLYSLELLYTVLARNVEVSQDVPFPSFTANTQGVLYFREAADKPLPSLLASRYH